MRPSIGRWRGPRCYGLLNPTSVFFVARIVWIEFLAALALTLARDFTDEAFVCHSDSHENRPRLPAGGDLVSAN